MRDHGAVERWMTREPLSVTVDHPIRQALGLMRGAKVRHLLVVDGDRLAGILSNRDVRRLVEDPAHPAHLTDPVGRIMTEDPVTVAPETPVTVAARLLLENRIGALPVRDGDTIVGIFTTADALDALLTLLEGPGR
jgi:CBS domain-containing protein